MPMARRKGPDGASPVPRCQASAEASRILEDHFNLFVDAPAALPAEEGEAELGELLARGDRREPVPPKATSWSC